MGIKGSNTATAYSKWYFVTTNVTDMRDWYTFHRDASWVGTAQWRVRAVRVPYGASRNDFTGASYGPWSPIYTTKTATPSPAPGPMSLGGTISDITATAATPRAHALMPGFYWNGNRSLYGDASELYRVYIYSDHDCVNPVYRGATVGSPAWVPRVSGPLSLPLTAADITLARANVLSDGGRETSSYTFDHVNVDPTEGVPSTAPAGSSGTTTSVVSPSTLTNPLSPAVTLDLWDRAWPSGAYFWTVIPVLLVTTDPRQTTLTAPAKPADTSITVSGSIAAGDVLTIAGESGSFVVTVVNGSTATLNRPLIYGHPAGEAVSIGGKLEYRDAELGQDACGSGRISTFGKISQPIAAGGKTPYVTALAANGQLETARSTKAPVVYGSPLVAWSPALGADEYEVQWSKANYPFQPEGQVFTYSTSALLTLSPGKWYYRVRGINFQMPAKARAMAWSKLQQVVVSKPVFAVASRS